MKRPSKKEIRAAVEKLKEKPSKPTMFDPQVGQLTSKKTSQRIRKHGI